MEEQAILILNGKGGTPGVIRTPDPLLRRLKELAYPMDFAARLATEKDIQIRSGPSSGT